MKTQVKDFWKQFKPKCCSLSLKGATKEAVYDELVSVLVKSDALAEDLSDAATKAIADREQLASTGVGNRVAIPHVKLEGLESVVVSIGIHSDGVDWDALDGEAVHIIFTVLRPAKASDQHDPERHLEMMQWISRLARDADFRSFAQAAKTKTELVDLLKEMSDR